MEIQIKDGVGKSYAAKVGSDNRLQVRAVRETEIIHNGESGNAYNINTGYITYTADGTLIYFKNTSDSKFVITDIVVGIRSNSSPVYSTNPGMTVVGNPTGGNLISDATAVSINQNRNLGSSNTLTGTVYTGKSGGTLTGGSDIALSLLVTSTRNVIPLDLILPKGSSMGITFDCNLTSGSIDVYTAIIGYYKDNEDV